jgi:biopolymer transport protein ExbD
MAQLTGNNKREAAKPDMTPMVDLGFLLITFFMYTTTFTNPVQLSFNQPIEDDDSTSEIMESNSLTIIIGKNDELLYHQTNLDDLTALTNISNSKSAFRKLLINSKKNAAKAGSFTVIIKPSEFSTYNGFVDVLDEMVIINQRVYAVVDISKKEMSLLL